MYDIIETDYCDLGDIMNKIKVIWDCWLGDFCQGDSDEWMQWLTVAHSLVKGFVILFRIIWKGFYEKVFFMLVYFIKF